MKKHFMNPELEVLRFKKGADVLLTSEDLGLGEGDADDTEIYNFRAGGGSRGLFDFGVD